MSCSAAILHRLREVSGLSIGELADQAGLTRECVRRIETGKRTARPATTRRLAAALGVTAYDLHPDSRSNLEVLAATLLERAA